MKYKDEEFDLIDEFNLNDIFLEKRLYLPSNRGRYITVRENPYGFEMDGDYDDNDLDF